MENKINFKNIWNCVTMFIIACLMILLFVVFVGSNDVVPKVGKYSLLGVNGESMDPLIKNGDLIVIDRTSKEVYEIGDVVSCIQADGSIITHEIVERDSDDNGYRYYTKGVNNIYQDNDYMELGQILGEYCGVRIPLLGYLVRLSNTLVGYVIMVVIPLGVICVVILKDFINEYNKKRGEC